MYQKGKIRVKIIPLFEMNEVFRFCFCALKNDNNNHDDNDDDDDKEKIQ